MTSHINCDECSWRFIETGVHWTWRSCLFIEYDTCRKCLAGRLCGVLYSFDNFRDNPWIPRPPCCMCHIARQPWLRCQIFLLSVHVKILFIQTPYYGNNIACVRQDGNIRAYLPSDLLGELENNSIHITPLVK